MISETQSHFNGQSGCSHNFAIASPDAESISSSSRVYNTFFISKVSCVLCQMPTDERILRRIVK